jgi:hypothetical protein
MKKATIFHCQTVTEATDRANLYYIGSATAFKMEKDTTGRAITITTRAGKALAVFQY